VRDFIGVDNRGAELAKDLRDGALARADSTGETDCKHFENL
jgi:hypothetical protein